MTYVYGAQLQGLAAGLLSTSYTNKTLRDTLATLACMLAVARAPSREQNDTLEDTVIWLSSACK